MDCDKLAKVLARGRASRAGVHGLAVLFLASLTGYETASAQAAPTRHPRIELGVAVAEGSHRLPRRPAGISGRASIADWGTLNVGVQASLMWPTAHRGYEPAYVGDNPDASRLSQITVAAAQLRWYVRPNLVAAGGYGVASGRWTNLRTEDATRPAVLSPAREYGVAWVHGRWSVSALLVEWSNVYRGRTTSFGELALRRGFW